MEHKVCTYWDDFLSKTNRDKETRCDMDIIFEYFEVVYK